MFSVVLFFFLSFNPVDFKGRHGKEEEDSGPAV